MLVFPSSLVSSRRVYVVSGGGRQHHLVGCAILIGPVWSGCGPLVWMADRVCESEDIQFDRCDCDHLTSTPKLCRSSVGSQGIMLSIELLPRVQGPLSMTYLVVRIHVQSNGISHVSCWPNQGFRKRSPGRKVMERLECIRCCARLISIEWLGLGILLVDTF